MLSISRILMTGVLLTVLKLSVSTALAQDFGKVFSTPEERNYLDRLRRDMFAELNEAQRIQALQDLDRRSNSIPEIVEVEEVPTLIHMGGSLTRADGSHSVWINGLSVDEADLPNNVELVFERGLGVLSVRTNSGVYRLRPGQTLNVEAGTVREDYELTEEQAASIRGEVARRDALTRRPQSAASAAVDETQAEETPEDNGQADLVREVLDALRAVQELQSTGSAAGASQ